MATKDQFQEELMRVFLDTTTEGLENVDVNAGELHRRVGGYPGRDHRMPVCCSVMRAEFSADCDLVLESPSSGDGASLTIRYNLPRKGEVGSRPEGSAMAAARGVEVVAEQHRDAEMPNEGHRFLETYWPWLVAAVPWLVAAVTFVILMITFRRDLFSTGAAKTWIVALAAIGLLIAANRAIYSPGPGNTDPTFVRYTILYTAVIAIIVGAAIVMIACESWDSPLLISLSCLLIGGFFGLLFGYPSGVAQQTANSPNGNTNPPKAVTPRKTLLAESASTLGKVITGFTLARAGDAHTAFHNACGHLAPAFVRNAPTGELMAGAVLSYFLATGFLSGLFLPTYFMSDKFGS
jgi:hypothetical protein